MSFLPRTSKKFAQTKEESATQEEGPSHSQGHEGRQIHATQAVGRAGGKATHVCLWREAGGWWQAPGALPGQPLPSWDPLPMGTSSWMPTACSFEVLAEASGPERWSFPLLPFLLILAPMSLGEVCAPEVKAEELNEYLAGPHEQSMD